MVGLKSGRGVQILVPSEEHIFSLNEDALEQLLLRDDIKDYPVVLVSVAGAYRKGKSFLLDFFLRYLYHTYILTTENEDWLGNPDDILEGFSWRGGSERNTTGLLLWSQPFIATLENGDKVVIYLMDTQGTFDSESTVKDNATVFALSTMLSSVQIYNLSQQIEEDDLQHLQLFTDYGRLALENSVGKPFQKLQFLVRDWAVAYEYAYGAEGGQQLLNKRLMISDHRHVELNSLRKHIVSCFDELRCFLMPHPGLTVATNPNFKGKLSDINDEFKQSLREFVPMLVAPENLTIKKIGGQTVKARDLLAYFKAYMNIFNGQNLPEPMTILEATAEVNNLSAAADAKEVYETLMTEIAGGMKPYLQPALLLEEHQRATDKALRAFHSKKKMGGDELSEKYAEKLKAELEMEYEQYRLQNDDKNILRRIGTLIVLVGLFVAALVLNTVGDVLGLSILSLLGTAGMYTSFVLILLWGYSSMALFVATLELTNVGDILGLSILGLPERGGVYASIALIVLWGYSRITGNLADYVYTLDKNTAFVMDYFIGVATKQATAAALNLMTDKKVM